MILCPTIGRRCKLCDGPLSPSATTGICSRNQTCHRANVRERRKRREPLAPHPWCRLCGGPMRPVAKYDICQRNPACCRASSRQRRGLTRPRRNCSLCGKPLTGKNVTDICSRQSCRREHVRRYEAHRRANGWGGWRPHTPEQRERYKARQRRRRTRPKRHTLAAQLAPEQRQARNAYHRAWRKANRQKGESYAARANHLATCRRRLRGAIPQEKCVGHLASRWRGGETRMPCAYPGCSRHTTPRRLGVIKRSLTGEFFCPIHASRRRPMPLVPCSVPGCTRIAGYRRPSEITKNKTGFRCPSHKQSKWYLKGFDDGNETIRSPST